MTTGELRTMWYTPGDEVSWNLLGAFFQTAVTLLKHVSLTDGVDLQLWRETPVSYQYLHIPPSSSPLVQDEIRGNIIRYLCGLWICRRQERSKKQRVWISRHNILPTCQYFLTHGGRFFFHLKAENITLLQNGNNILLCPFFKGWPAGRCRPGKIRKLLSQMTLSLY